VLVFPRCCAAGAGSRPITTLNWEPWRLRLWLPCLISSRAGQHRGRTRRGQQRICMRYLCDIYAIFMRCMQTLLDMPYHSRRSIVLYILIFVLSLSFLSQHLFFMCFWVVSRCAEGPPNTALFCMCIFSLHSRHIPTTLYYFTHLFI